MAQNTAESRRRTKFQLTPLDADRMLVISIMRVILLAPILVLLSGCKPQVSQQQLGFLTTQTKPLIAKAMQDRLGWTKLSNGPFYSYRIRGERSTVEFWIAPPTSVTQVPSSVAPVEIALVVIKTDSGNPSVIWPEELKGKDFDKSIAALWQQKP